jgi:hypothetical protein
LGLIQTRSCTNTIKVIFLSSHISFGLRSKKQTLNMTNTDEESINSFEGKGGKAAVEEKSAPGENRKVHRGFCISRSLVVVVLLVSAAVVGSLAYVFVKGDEDDDYHSQVRTV